MTFNRAFKDIFGSELTEKGYKYSAKLGRFVKVKNDELIYSVGYRNIPAIYHNKKCFTITAGIRTIYYEGINKWTFESTESDLQVFSSIPEWIEFAYDELDMYDVVKNSRSRVKELVLPVFDNVKDLESYITFATRNHIDVFHYSDRFAMDSLVLFLTDNHEDFEEQILRASVNSDENFVRKCMYEYLIGPRDRVYNDKKLYKRALEEATRRKKENLETLHMLKAI